MARMRSILPQAISAMGGSLDQAAKIARGAEVRRMWETIMHRGGDEYILAHTNNVFILREGEARPLRSDHDDRKDAGATGKGKQLIAYVDESIVAAELNARRELVKLQFRQLFDEDIDEFKIIISHGQYRKHHPFAQEERPGERKVRPVALDEEERAMVRQQVEAVESPQLRRALERAMIADLEWKKALR